MEPRRLTFCGEQIGRYALELEGEGARLVAPPEARGGRALLPLASLTVLGPTVAAGLGAHVALTLTLASLFGGLLLVAALLAAARPIRRGLLCRPRVIEIPLASSPESGGARPIEVDGRSLEVDPDADLRIIRDAGEDAADDEYLLWIVTSTVVVELARRRDLVRAQREASCLVELLGGDGASPAVEPNLIGRAGSVILPLLLWALGVLPLSVGALLVIGGAGAPGAIAGLAMGAVLLVGAAGVYALYRLLGRRSLAASLARHYGVVGR